MFSKPINKDKQPFPYSILGGVLGNYSWFTLLGQPSSKIIPIAVIQLLSVVGVLTLAVFGLMIILLFDGSLTRNGIIAWISSVLVSVFTIVLAKKLIRELVAMARVLRHARQIEKLQQQKISDMKIHL